MVSTASDYAVFLEMLRNGGVVGSTRILSPKTIELMTMNHLLALVSAAGSGEQPGLGGRGGSGFGLGFAVITDVPATQVIGSTGEYNWGGAAGTIFWVDPVADLFVVSMIQLMGSPSPLRSELKALTYQALTEPARPPRALSEVTPLHDERRKSRDRLECPWQALDAGYVSDWDLIFTPLDRPIEGVTCGTIMRPPTDGTAGWAGAAVDPETGMVYIPSRNRATVVQLYTPDPALGATVDYTHGAPEEQMLTGAGSSRGPQMPQGLPLVKPPHSRMTAIDLDNRRH